MAILHLRQHYVSGGSSSYSSTNNTNFYLSSNGNGSEISAWIVFSKEWLNGKKIRYTRTKGGYSDVVAYRIYVEIMDGGYDPSSAIHFPSGAPRINLGNGRLLMIEQVNASSGTSTITTGVLNLSGASSDRVSLCWRAYSANSAYRYELTVSTVEILDADNNVLYTVDIDNYTAIGTESGQNYGRMGTFPIDFFPPIPVTASLAQPWGLWSDHLVSACLQPWILMDSIVLSDCAQAWGMRLGADLTQRWSDAPVAKGVFDQPWGNAGVVRAQLVQRWRDMVTLRVCLDQTWAIMESLLVALEQPWAITSGPVQALLTQGWAIKEIELVLAVLHQPWAIASDGTVLRYTVLVLADGQAVRVSHINIEGGLDESGDVLTCEIHPETEAEYLLCPFGAELQVSITSQEGTDAFAFVVTSPRIDERHGATSYVVEAMSPAVMLGAPYAAGIEGELAGLASEIAATLAGDLSVSWETVDWHIPAATWIASGDTPLALLKTLAAAVGALVQSDPDGTIAIRPRYPVSVPNWGAAQPDVVLTETLDCFESGSTPDHRSGYNRFLVSNQSSSADSLTLEQTDISSAVKEVRGYQVPWDGAIALTHTGGSWVVIDPQGVEERDETETVEFVAGAGATQYPIYGLVSVAWQQTNLGTITTAEEGTLTASISGQSLCEITYTTKCQLWRVTDSNNEQLQLVAEL